MHQKHPPAKMAVLVVGDTGSCAEANGAVRPRSASAMSKNLDICGFEMCLRGIFRKRLFGAPLHLVALSLMIEQRPPR